MDRGEREASFVRTMVALAQSLGVEVVAEGIEYASQFSALDQLGCDIGQGYLLSRPLESSQLKEYLTSVAQPDHSRAA